jgi:glutathione S-transferase
LLQKGVDFDVNYIDLANRPQWFLDISPLGKVPALRVDDAVLFESAVINEYLDEVNPPSMHPADALERAKNRAWIEFASTMLGNQYKLMVEKDEQAFNTVHDQLLAQLDQLGAQLGDGPYFNGADFALIDAACAPLFTRFKFLENKYGLSYLPPDTKLGKWAETLVALESVKKSVVPEFDQLLLDYISAADGHIVSLAAD